MNNQQQNSSGGLNTNIPTPATASVFNEPIAMSGSSSPTIFTNNGHYYEFIAATDLTWEQARDAAASRTFEGRQGYLATVTSEAEKNFVQGLLSGNNVWLGGSDATSEGQWTWVTGPEAGVQFWNNGATTEYNNWNSGVEPNGGANENYLAMIGNPNLSEILGRWHDSPLGAGGGDYGTTGYVVEYGGLPGDVVQTSNRLNDLYWRNYTTGENAYWQINSTDTETGLSITLEESNFLASQAGKDWVIDAIADFNGDNQSDLFFNNYATGETQVWLLQKDVNTGEVTRQGEAVNIYQIPEAGWKVAGTADFDANGIADVIWRNQDGRNGIWIMASDGNSVSIGGGYFIDSATPEWSIEHVADVNNNGIYDLVWRNNSTGVNAVWEISYSPAPAPASNQAIPANVANNPFTRTAAYFVTPIEDINSTLAAVTDVNGDNILDWVWHNDVTGVTKIWQMSVGGNGQVSRNNETNLINTGVNAGWELAGVTDLNTDTTPDFIWRNYLTGANAGWTLNYNSETGTISVDKAELFTQYASDWILEGVETANANVPATT